MTEGGAGKARGILYPWAGPRAMAHHRHLPSPDLAAFVEHHWSVRWDLRGQTPFVAATLPHPSVHLVLERDRSRLIGVMTGKFSETLTGVGRVFGVKFRPGGFYPFVQRSVARYTDAAVPPGELFGPDGDALEVAVLAHEDDAGSIGAAEAFLRARLPDPDPTVATVGEITRAIAADRGLLRVDDVAARFALSTRAVQRLFHRYVGVSPKWVIRRYRLHEAAERLAGGEVVDWTGLALELGYFDQAHFINDWKALVGTAPAEYTRTDRDAG